MNEKYAIFLDIDGTYNYGAPVPPSANVEAVEKARQAGHKVFINTGRSYGFIPKEVLDSTEFDGIIAGDGSYIKLGDRVVKSDRIDTETLVSIAGHFSKGDTHCLFEGENDILSLNIEKGDPAWLRVDNAEDFRTKFIDVPVTKLTITGHLQKDDKEFIETYLHLIEFEAYCEAIIKGNNKAQGIREVLTYIGIPQENCIAMGDSLNDMDMIRFAGIGVAMGNATDDLKAEADFVSVHAKDGGVAYAIDKFVLDKKS